MSNSRLDFKVNTQQLTGLEKILKRVFSRDVPRAFNTEVAGVNRQLDAAHRQMAAVVKQMDNVGRGTAQFKKLQDQLKAVNSEIDTLNRSLSHAQGRAGGVGGGMRPIGRAGGGTSTASFGLGSIQAPSPSIGGMAHALSGIPLGGMAAAGALMTAAQAYGSYMQWQQAQMQAAPYLMSSSGMFGFQGPSGGGGGNPFGRRSAGGQFTAREERLMELYGNLPDDPVARATAMRMRRRSRMGRVGAIASIYEDIRGLLTGDEFGAAAKADAMISSTRMDEEIAAIAAGNNGRYRPGDRTFDAWGYSKVGQAFGLTPQAALQQASGFAQAAGRPTGAGEFGAALALQQLFGVSTQATGAHMLASRWTGNMGDVQEVANLIGVAVSGGLEGSEISMLLQEQSGWLRGMYQQGNNVTLPGILTGAATLSASGVIDPFRQMSYSRDFGAGAARMSRAGPQTGADLRLMRAMGFTGQKGFEEYAQYRLMGQDAGVASGAMYDYLKSFMDPNMGQWSQALVLQQAMGAMGANITADDALRMSQGLSKGSFTEVDLKKIVEAGKGLASATGGSVIAQAGIEAERIGVGGEVAPAVQALERASLNLAQTLTGTLGQAVNDFAYAVEDATSLISGAINNWQSGIAN